MMLNTDLHNSNVRADKKMKVEDFIRNLRGISAFVLHLFQSDVNIIWQLFMLFVCYVGRLSLCKRLNFSRAYLSSFDNFRLAIAFSFL